MTVLKNGVKLILSGCVNGSKNMVSVALATAVAGVVVGAFAEPTPVRSGM